MSNLNRKIFIILVLAPAAIMICYKVFFWVEETPKSLLVDFYNLVNNISPQLSPETPRKRILEVIEKIQTKDPLTLEKEDLDFIRLNPHYFFEAVNGVGTVRKELVMKLLTLQADPVGNIETGEIRFLPQLVLLGDDELLQIVLQNKMDLSVFYGKYGLGLVELSVLQCVPHRNTTKILLESPSRDSVFCPSCLMERYKITLPQLAEIACPELSGLVKHLK